MSTFKFQRNKKALARKNDKHRRYRRKGTARPRRYLSIGYRGVPNQYRFVRETRPTIIDLGYAAGGVSLIPGTAPNPDMSTMTFPGFQMNQLPGFSEFAALFANYKIDMVETILIPQWSETVNPYGVAGGANPPAAIMSNLMITRICTKYLPGGLVILPTAEDMRDQLAQIQKKTRSLYGSKKWLRIKTKSPDIWINIQESQSGVLTNKVLWNQPWLPTGAAADQEFQLNDRFFADTLNGAPFVRGLYMYRMYHRVHFRAAFVG